MQQPVRAFLDALDARQRAAATYPFETDERFRWQYTPGRRGGLPLADMDDRQRELALAMVDAGLSADGAATARQIMELEPILRDIEQRAGRSGAERRDAQFYWFSVFGDPMGPAPWGWRLGGHHLCLHFTVVGHEVSVTPLFFGANPAKIPHGLPAGRRTLAAEEDLARRLVESLNDGQRRTAVLSASAPSDIRTRNAERAEIAAVPSGIPYSQLDAEQRAVFESLVGVYTGRVRRPPPVALDELRFAWLGSTRPGEGHYYAIRTDTTLFEYDNTQDGANHIHTVWRDIRRDWGTDLLAEHYRSAHV